MPRYLLTLLGSNLVVIYMRNHVLLIYCWLCVLLFLSESLLAQRMDTGHKVDTLSMKERVSFRTNAVDWLLLVPNIGVEFDLRRYNWNRWAVGLNLRANWQSSHTFKPGVVYNVAEVRAEVRNYYRIRLLDGKYIVPKEHKWERWVSPRRAVSKHPTTTYYRGAFVAYNNFSLKFGDEGRQGSALIGGLLFGIIRPMYAFANGNTLDFELGTAIGVAFANYDTFRHDPQDDCYPIVARQQTTVMPVINDLRIGFVYRFGNYPITSKYRWRYDVDVPYQQRLDDIIMNRRIQRAEKQRSDSIEAVVRNLFWQKYDSLVKVLPASEPVQKPKKAEKIEKPKKEEKPKKAEKSEKPKKAPKPKKSKKEAKDES